MTTHEDVLADPNAALPDLRAAAQGFEALGQTRSALRAWQRVLRLDQTDAAAWEALAVLHEERGDLERAGTCRQRLATLRGQSAPDPLAAEDEPEPLLDVKEADLVRLTLTFAGRDGVHARMWSDPRRGVGYSPVQHPLGPDVWRAHLDGAITAGVYLVRSDDTCSLLVLDLDARKPALDAARGHADRTRDLYAAIAAAGVDMLRRARELGLDPVLEDSGYKGRHLWFFLEGAQPAALVRAAGGKLAALLQPKDHRLTIEVFPKQDHVPAGGLGNLVKLPLGIHLRTNRRCAVLDAEGRPVSEPFGAIRRARRLTASDLHQLAGRHAPPIEVAPPEASPERPAAPPVDAAPEWTDADFERAPAVASVLQGCAVLRRVVNEARRDRKMSRSRMLVLQHTLGHLAEGPRAVNHLLHRCEVPADLHMGASHRGSPTSCRKVRTHVPDVVSQVPCDCIFPDEPGQYPNPMRHVDLTAPPPRRQRDLPELLDAYARQLERIASLETEADTLRKTIVETLEQIPDRAWAVEDGTWALHDEGGLPVLRFRKA